MADVRPPRAGGDGRKGRGGGEYLSDSRGQLFIVGALALAVLLVTLAMLLNTAIYAGNIATRDPGPGTTGVIEFENEAVDATGQLMDGVNHANNSSYTDLDSAYNNSTANWSAAVNVHTNMLADDAYVEVTGTTHGTRIVQDSRRNFTDESGSASWTLVNDVEARAWEMDVHRANLTEPTTLGSIADLLAEPVFYIEITDTAGTWEVFVFKDSSDVVVEVSDTSDNSMGECRTTTANPTISLSDATLNGQHCQALADLGDNVTAPYDIDYTEADEVEGNYSLVVSKLEGSMPSSRYYADGSGNDPYYTHALYSAEVNVTYRSPLITYRTNVTVAPGEFHD